MLKSQIELGRFWPTRTVRAESRKVYSTPARLQNCVGWTFAYSSGGRLKIVESSQLWNDRVSNLLLRGFFFLSRKIVQLSKTYLNLHRQLSGLNVSVCASGVRAKRSKEQGVGGETRWRHTFTSNLLLARPETFEASYPTLPGDQAKAM